MKLFYILLLGMIMIPFVNNAQLTFEVRDAYTFEPINGV